MPPVDCTELSRKFESIDDELDEVKLRLVKIEDFNHDLHVQHATLSTSVENMIEKQDESEAILKQIHASVLKSEGAVQALKEDRHQTHNENYLAIGKKSHYLSIAALIFGSSILTRIVEFFMKGH
jgi:DNA-binding FrmR family transcriptional regulator